jgi:uncharacterized protein YukE
MAPPSGSATDYSGPFNTAFDQIRENLKKALDDFNKLVDKVNDHWWLFGAAPMLWMKHNLDKVRDALKTLGDKVNFALQHQWPVVSLIDTSFDWIGKAKTPTSDLSFAATEPRDENLAKWTGDAASAYNSKATKQKAAIDEAVVKEEFISAWLFKIAKANVDFAATLAKMANDIAGKLAQAVVDAATVIDLPWAIDTLAGLVGTILKDELDALVTIGQKFVDALGNVRDLATQVGDHSKLPGGKWPEAVRG